MISLSMIRSLGPLLWLFDEVRNTELLKLIDGLLEESGHVVRVSAVIMNKIDNRAAAIELGWLLVTAFVSGSTRHPTARSSEV